MERDVLEFLLDGLEAVLELERELGVRSLECDRGLLEELRTGKPPAAARAVAAPPPPPPAQADAKETPPPPPPTPRESTPSQTAAAPTAKPQERAAQATAPTATSAGRRFAFLNDRPLSPKAAAFLEKVMAAMGETPESAPVVFKAPPPPAKIYIVMGALSLRKWFPGKNAGPGDWLKMPDGETEALVIMSPEKIVRFATVTPAVQKLKYEMWQSLKTAIGKARLQ